MSTPTLCPLNHRPSNHPLSNHPAVLQPRLFDQLQADLHRALHQAPAVIVDLIWLDAIDPATVTILKNAIHLAAQLGKSIAFHGANRELSAVLAEEQARLRNQALGARQANFELEFNAFLRDRAGHPAEAAPKSEILFPQFGRSSSRSA